MSHLSKAQLYASCAHLPQIRSGNTTTGDHLSYLTVDSDVIMLRIGNGYPRPLKNNTLKMEDVRMNFESKNVLSKNVFTVVASPYIYNSR